MRAAARCFSRGTACAVALMTWMGSAGAAPASNAAGAIADKFSAAAEASERDADAAARTKTEAKEKAEAKAKAAAKAKAEAKAEAEAKARAAAERQAADQRAADEAELLRNAKEEDDARKAAAERTRIEAEQQA